MASLSSRSSTRSPSVAAPEPSGPAGGGLMDLIGNSGMLEAFEMPTVSPDVVDWFVGENGGAAWGDIWDCMTGDQEWASGPTGGFMPQSLADEMDAVGGMVPADAAENGMHAWHAGTNAMLAEQLGVVGAPLIFAGGLFHETPLDWGSWWAEEDAQGTVNHRIDSEMDIVANLVGMGYGYFDDSGHAVEHAIEAGNRIPGPGDPDPAFGGAAGYDGDPTRAW